MGPATGSAIPVWLEKPHMTCDSCAPVVTTHARRGPAVPDAGQTQRGLGPPRSRLPPVPFVADAFGAPVLRDQGPDRPAGHGKADQSLSLGVPLILQILKQSCAEACEAWCVLGASISAFGPNKPPISQLPLKRG